MNKKLIIGLGILAVTGFSGVSTANAGPASLAKTGINAPKQLVENVAFRPGGIAKRLRAAGYYNIVVTDARLPVYQARACKNGKRFHIRMNRWGGIFNRDRIGNCRPWRRHGAMNDGYYYGGPRVVIVKPGYRGPHGYKGPHKGPHGKTVYKYKGPHNNVKVIIKKH